MLLTLTMCDCGRIISSGKKTFSHVEHAIKIHIHNALDDFIIRIDDFCKWLHDTGNIDQSVNRAVIFHDLIRDQCDCFAVGNIRGMKTTIARELTRARFQIFESFGFEVERCNTCATFE